MTEQSSSGPLPPNYKPTSITRLAGQQDYPLWKIKITMYLRRLQLFKNNEPVDDKDATALSIIFDNLNETLQQQAIHVSASASDLWEYISKTFEKTDLSTKAKAIQNLVDFNYQEATMDMNYSKIMTIQQELKSAFNSDTISFENMTTIFSILNLPKHHHLLRTTMMENAKDDKQLPALSSLFSSLLREESLSNESGARQVVSTTTTNQCQHRFTPANKCWKCHPCQKCQAGKKDRTYHTINDKWCQKNWSDDTKASRAKTFVVDSACTDTMAANKDGLTLYSHPIAHPIRVANNQTMIADEIGSLTTPEMNLDVLICKELSENLLSTNDLANQKVHTLFTEEGVFIGKGGSLNEIFHKGYRKDKSFYVNLKNQPSTLARVTTVEEDHLKLNHLNARATTRATATANITPINCDACYTGKATKGTKPKTATNRANKPGERFHTDICGPITPTSNNGHRYLLTFTDDYSRYVTVFFLQTKAEAFEKFHNLDSVVYNQFGRHIKYLRSDNGTEFKNSSFTDYCKLYGIHQEFTVTYTPSQNGVAERLNLTIFNYLRATLKSSKLDKSFWHEIIQNICYTKNRTVIATNQKETAFAKYFDQKGDISHLQVCGAPCYAITTPWEKRKSYSFKLADRAQLCKFLGYSTNKKAYRLLTETNQIIEVCYEDVRFPESTPTVNTAPVTPTETTLQSEINQINIPDNTNSETTQESNETESDQESSDQESVYSTPIKQETFHTPVKQEARNVEPETEEQETEKEETQNPPVAEYPTLRSIPNMPGAFFDPSRSSTVTLQPISDPAPKDINAPPAFIKRIRKATKRFDPSSASRAFSAISATREEHVNVSTADALHHSGIEWFRLPPAFARSAKGEPLPAKYEDIEALADKKEWLKATDAEIASLIEHDTWQLVDLPANRRALKNKWVFRIKRDAQGSITRYKARLCACGYSQQENIDYKDIYAPVVRPESFRVFLATIAARNMECHQMDVTAAFLNGNLEETIYMKQPPGYINKECPDKVCKIIRNLYGLKQASRVWHKTIDPFLKSLGFTPLASDPCVYFKWDKDQLSMISLYVDDLAIASDSPEILDSTKQALSSRFKMTDEGELDYILGMQIKRDRNKRELHISSHLKISEILKDFNMASCDTVATPMEHLTISAADCPTIGSKEWTEMQEVPYRQCVGRLVNLMRTTRPDLAFAVSVVSRYLHNPGRKHWNMVKRIMRYLSGTKTFTLRIAPNQLTTTAHAKDAKVNLVGNLDADWGGNRDNCKSTSGFSFFVGNGLVSWGSKAQPTVATSSTHAEYVAAYQATAECLWIRSMLLELKLLPQDTPTVLKCDNQAAIKIANYQMVTPQSKHFDQKYHFVRHEVEEGHISLLFCPGKDNVADIFTKPLARTKFQKFRTELGIIADPGESNAC